MPVFAQPADLYDLLRATFQRVQDQMPGCFGGLLSARLTLRLKTTQPPTQMLLNGRRAPVQITFGPSADRADLEAEVAADDLHLMLMHQLSIKKAMANRRIRVRGPAWKLSVLIAIIQAARQFYPDLLAAHA
jgi:hypothetical protein